MFVAKDRDHDGKLSFEEFVGQETKLERAFKAMDKDGDGFITKVTERKLQVVAELHFALMCASIEIPLNN